MKDAAHLLTFVRTKESELVLHADAQGLSLLISALQSLKEKTEAGGSDHDHLKTSAWAGTELTESRGSESGELIHHLKVYAWSEESAVKHGFRS
jgi:hypothetical protein